MTIGCDFSRDSILFMETPPIKLVRKNQMVAAVRETYGEADVLETIELPTLMWDDVWKNDDTLKQTIHTLGNSIEVVTLKVQEQLVAHPDFDAFIQTTMRDLLEQVQALTALEALFINDRGVVSVDDLDRFYHVVDCMEKYASQLLVWQSQVSVTLQQLVLSSPVKPEFSTKAPHESGN